MQSFLFIKDGGKRVRISITDLYHIEAARRYVKFVTSDKIYTVNGPLSVVEQWLPPDQFCRIHRSHIVSLQHITWFTSKSVIVGTKKLPVGRQYLDILSQKANIDCHVAKLTKKQINNLFRQPGHL